MSEYTYPSSDVLAEIIRRIEAITPDQFISPFLTVPDVYLDLGEVQDDMKALFTFKYMVDQAHDLAHERENLKYGGNENLDDEHIFMHYAQLVARSMIAGRWEAFSKIHQHTLLR